MDNRVFAGGRRRRREFHVESSRVCRRRVLHLGCAAPVLALLSVRLCSDYRAAPYARARGDRLGGVSEAAVVRQQLAPRRIHVAGLADLVQQHPDVLLRGSGRASRLVVAAYSGVCYPPVY